jgi:DNA-binding MarR family transcriptional regulator
MHKTEKYRTNKLCALATFLHDGLVEDLAALSDSSAAALMTLDHFGPTTASALASVLRLTQPATVRLIERLEAAGLAARGQRQGRQVPLTLTAKGRRQTRRLSARRVARAAARLDVLTLEERRTLDGLVTKLLHGAVRRRADARHLCRFCDHALCRGAGCPVGSGVMAEGEERPC